VEPRQLYEAGLTVMLRLVFLLAAEERGLLPRGDAGADSFHSISGLRGQLRAESDELLARCTAWPRLLAAFRAAFGGADDPRRGPAAVVVGGSFFDPDRFPFLEGRRADGSGRPRRADSPLPIDDRTVLLLLGAVQTGGRPLDVEQLGEVYEGLLERTVERVEDVTLELDAGARVRDARVRLGELAAARLEGEAAVVSLLVERTKRSRSAISGALAAADIDPRQRARLLSACRGDVRLCERVAPYRRLLRTDPWGDPLVHLKGALVVVPGAGRRQTGAHYTPRDLTERIVEETLAPLVSSGPAEGAPRSEWRPKTPAQLLDLRVCDPAMGAGAFLVQACRFVSERLVEAWAAEEAAGRIIDLTGASHAPGAAVECLPSGDERRAGHARRLVAERCLYGVDRDPLAVELAKLSLGLTALAEGQPFGFPDRNLRCGDSLLGATRLEPLAQPAPTPSMPAGTGAPATPVTSGAFHWPLEFPDVFLGPRRGFDAVIGNPPYAFGETRPDVPQAGYTLRAGQWDLCWLFLERASAIVSPEGRLGFVLPDAILARKEATVVRRFVLSSFESVSIDHLGTAFQAGVSVFSMVAGRRAGASCRGRNPTGTLWYRAPGQAAASLPIGSISDGRHPWSAPLPEPAVLAAMASWRCIGDIASISRGEEVGKKHLAPVATSPADDGDTVPVLAGSGVVSVLAQPSATHALSRRLVRKDASRYASPKIVVVKTGHRMRAGIDRQGLVTLQSLYNIQLDPDCGFRIEYVAAVLVSDFANATFILPVTRGKTLFPQITQQMIRSTRVPPASIEEQGVIADCVEAGQIERMNALVSALYARGRE